MSIAVYRPAKFLINTVPIPFSNLSLEPGFALFLQQNGIQVDPTYVGIQGIAPVISVDTFDIGLLISTVGFTGLASTTFELHFVLVGSGAVAALGSTGVKVSGTEGLSTITSITANGGEGATEAVGSMELHPLGTASVAPFIVESAQAAPTAVELAAGYYLGPVTFNGRTYDPTNVNIQPNLEIAKRQSDGLAWPTWAGVPRRAAQIDISTEQVLALDDMSDGVTDEIEGCKVADTEIYFRKSTIGIARVANASDVHVKVTAASAMVHPSGLGGALDGFASQDVTITPLSTDNNPSLVFAVTRIT